MNEPHTEIVDAQQASDTHITELATTINDDLESIFGALDMEQLRQTFVEQDQLLVLERLLPSGVTTPLAAEVDQLEAQVHRGRVPGYKKSGSVSYYTLMEQGPLSMALYRAPAFQRFLSELTGRELLRCPDDDPHACALYYYTEPGDRVGWHYDSSWYEGERFTVLIGAVEQSSSELQCRLHTRNPEREDVDLSLTTHPGTVVIFNGDTIYHQVTPLGSDERRVILTTEFVTDQRMGRFKRAISNLKDSMAYFGFSALFRRRPGSS